MKTGIYVRVSTEDQAQEGFSIRAQIEKLKSYALLKDWEIYDIYSDEGISGKNIVARPAINRLIDDIKSGKVNNVLVFKVDRLTRSTKNLIELVDLFEENKCTFNSLTESIDTDTPSGRMFLKIIGIFAEFERENLISRVRLGYERKAREGYSLSSFGTSYGYDIKKGEKIQTINPTESKIVREIFEAYVNDNISMLAIAKNLTERGIKTKKGSSKWNKSTIRSMLENPNYIGKVRYGTQDKDRYFEADGQHEAIIDSDLFRLAHEKLSKNHKNRITKVAKEDKYFCGVLYCGDCGLKFSTHQYRNIRKDGSEFASSSYKCSGIHYDGCKMPNIVHWKIEELFNEYVANINALEAKNAEIKNTDTADKKRLILEYIADCENKLKVHEERKKKVMGQYVGGDISFEEYRNLMDLSSEQCETLEKEIVKSTAEIPAENESKITRADIITDLTENWQRLTNKERMIFLQRFVKKIVIKAERIGERKSILSIAEPIEFDMSSETPRQQLKKVRADKQVSFLDFEAKRK
jgi:site-specific DNA recombinase